MWIEVETKEGYFFIARVCNDMVFDLKAYDKEDKRIHDKNILEWADEAIREAYANRNSAR